MSTIRGQLPGIGRILEKTQREWYWEVAFNNFPTVAVRNHCFGLNFEKAGFSS